MTPVHLLSMESLGAAAEVFKVMGHPVRLRIVEILMQGEFSVTEIAEMCELPHSQTCEHLRLLKGQGLLTSERRGRAVYYGIASPRLPKLIQCVRSTCGTNDKEKRG